MKLEKETIVTELCRIPGEQNSHSRSHKHLDCLDSRGSKPHLPDKNPQWRCVGHPPKSQQTACFIK